MPRLSACGRRASAPPAAFPVFLRVREEIHDGIDHRVAIGEHHGHVGVDLGREVDRRLDAQRTKAATDSVTMSRTDSSRRS